MYFIQSKLNMESIYNILPLSVGLGRAKLPRLPLKCAPNAAEGLTVSPVSPSSTGKQVSTIASKQLTNNSELSAVQLH